MNPQPKREPFPPRWAFLVLAVLILGALSWTVYDRMATTADKNTSQANTQTLAQDILTVCTSQGKLMVEDRDLCAKATQVQENPTDAIPGPKGDPGVDGKNGLQGARGEPGMDSTVPAPRVPPAPIPRCPDLQDLQARTARTARTGLTGPPRRRSASPTPPESPTPARRTRPGPAPTTARAEGSSHERIHPTDVAAHHPAVGCRV
jgi:hypothetical protein